MIDVASGTGSRPERVASYARVSTEEQADEGTSLDSQVERCRLRAESEGWVLVGEFVDRGVSGALASRPELDRVMRLVEDGAIERVVITKLDRIARSLRNLLDLLDTFEKHSVVLVALDDPLDPSTASGRAMVHLRGVFAELERQLIRERTVEGKLRRIAEGCWMGGEPPYGYRAVQKPDGPGKVLEIDPEEAAVVRLAYNMIVHDGCSTGEVALELRRLGGRPRRSAEWSHWHVRRLFLDARGLSGQWPWRRAGRRGQRADGELIVQIPAILTQEEHESLLAAMSATSTQPASRRSYVLRGRLFSPHGTRMQGVPGYHREGTRYYRCPHRQKQLAPNGEKCDCGRLRADIVEQVVWDEILALLDDPATLESLAAEYEDGRSAHALVERDRLAEMEGGDRPDDRTSRSGV